MQIGVLGAGLMGSKLGTIFARAGHDVVFSYSHDDRKLQRIAREAGGTARAGTPADAADGADAILLAVHWSRVRDALKQAGRLTRIPIVSCSLPMNKSDTALVVGHTSSGAEALARMVPKAHVVSAFSTVPSEVLFAVAGSRRTRTRPHAMYCGDHDGAKRIAARLIRDAGFEPLDAGPLTIARYLEPASLLIAQLAYEGRGGPALAYRFERFARKGKSVRSGRG